MLYYRGLSFVVVSSLVIAGLITYACVLLLGHAYGFTLTLPGIAGLIVAVGITADSFIVYFERLRDEVRDGKTLRTSVETGWARARMHDRGGRLGVDPGGAGAVHLRDR